MCGPTVGVIVGPRGRFTGGPEGGLPVDLKYAVVWGTDREWRGATGKSKPCQVQKLHFSNKIINQTPFETVEVQKWRDLSNA